jgi:hypothetical protein
VNNVPSNEVRRLVAQNSFGLGPKNYLIAKKLLGDISNSSADLKKLSDILAKDEIQSKNTNIFRISIIIRISEIICESLPKEIEEKFLDLEKDGGALIDGQVLSVNQATHPLELILPFGLDFGTSRDYFEYTTYKSNLSKAKNQLFSFFDKLNRGKINKSSQSWKHSLAFSSREIYENIIQHSFHNKDTTNEYRYSEEFKNNRCKFWVFSYRRYVYVDNEYFSRLREFSTFHSHFTSKKPKLFVAINISDDGLGMKNYFNLCCPGSSVDSIYEIINSNLSSSDIVGAGDGCSNAIDRVTEEDGYIMFSSGEDFYVNYKDQNTDDRVEIKGKLDEYHVGTSVDMLIPLFE